MAPCKSRRQNGVNVYCCIPPRTFSPHWRFSLALFSLSLRKPMSCVEGSAVRKVDIGRRFFWTAFCISTASSSSSKRVSPCRLSHSSSGWSREYTLCVCHPTRTTSELDLKEIQKSRGMVLAEVSDVDEIKVLAIDEEASDKNMPIVKLDSTSCIVSPPIESSKAFHLLSWQRLTMCLICEAIALGCLSMPAAFATLGMVWGVIATVVIGLIAIYISLIVGETKFRNPHLTDYAEIGRLLFGDIGWYVVATMLVMLLVLTTGSHVLTGIIAFESLFDHKVCSVTFGIVSAMILFLFALPKTFHSMAVLAYIDFASITAAVLMTIIVSGIESRAKEGGLNATTWYAFLPVKERPDFVQVMLSLTNIALAYAFAHCLPSFMSELKRPQDYRKSLCTLGLVEIAFYTIIGGTIYAFKGKDVKAPALLSISPLMQKIVFGLALPVIFISGSINSQTAAKFLYDLAFAHTPHKYMDTKKGMLCWIGIGLGVTTIAWIAAEVIPSFSTFLGLIAALFTACFTFTIPACMYFKVLRNHKTRPSNSVAYLVWLETGLNGFILAAGIFLLFAGSACCIISLVRDFRAGVSAPFSC